MKKKNKLSRPSKDYILKVLLFAGNTLMIILLVVFVILAYTSLKKYIPDSILNIPFSLIGFLLPLEKYFFDGIRDTMPWEASIRAAINAKKLKKDDFIRISYAAFAVIEINGKYLLKKNTHGLETYTNPAYSYRMTLEKKEELDKEFSIKIKNYYKDKDWYDYRLFVKVSELKKFYHKFLNDVDPCNYDYSGLSDVIIESLHLNKETFGDVKLEFKTRIIPKVEYSRKVDHYEMYVKDKLIFLPTPEQFEILKQLMNKEIEDVHFVSLETIKQCGADESIGKYNNDIPEYIYDDLVSY